MDKYWGHRNKKHKKTAFCRCQCFAPAVSAVACLISSRGLNQPHHNPNAALLRGRWHRQKDKNRSPSAKNPVGTWYFTSAHNFNTILIINYLSRTRSIASLPCKIVWEIWYDLCAILILVDCFGCYPWWELTRLNLSLIGVDLAVSPTLGRVVWRP